MQPLEKFITSALRRYFGRTPQHKAALDACRRETFVGNRKRVFFQYAHCGEWFPRKDVHVDHCECVICPVVGWVDYNTFIERLFTDNLQVLCKQCHAVKSAAENVHRRARAKPRKPTKRRSGSGRKRAGAPSTSRASVRGDVR
jgi:hypothetical protein